MPWPDSGVGRNAMRVSARAANVLGIERQVEEGDRDLVYTPEVGGMSLRTARRVRAWVLFLAKVNHPGLIGDRFAGGLNCLGRSLGR